MAISHDRQKWLGEHPNSWTSFVLLGIGSQAGADPQPATTKTRTVDSPLDPAR